MCFSAEASFAAAAVLAPAGAYCVSQALRKDPRLIPLALVPALFAVQQVAEGFVWLGLHDGDVQRARAAALVFLFVAMIGWPVWTSFSAVFAASNRILRILFVASFLWVWIYSPVFLEPEHYLSISIVQHSIRYDYSGLPVYGLIPLWGVRVLYITSVALPWGLVWHRHVHFCVLGLLFALSIMVTQFFYSHAFASVWCFFAAIISAYLVAVFRAMPHAGEAHPTSITM